MEDFFLAASRTFLNPAGPPKASGEPLKKNMTPIVFVSIIAFAGSCFAVFTNPVIGKTHDFRNLGLDFRQRNSGSASRGAIRNFLDLSAFVFSCVLHGLLYDFVYSIIIFILSFVFFVVLFSLY